jgi:hypothetical protein
MMYSVIACTIYWLKPFMAAISTHYGAAAIDVAGFEATKGRTADYSHGSIRQDESRSDSKAGSQLRSAYRFWSRNGKSPQNSEVLEEELKDRRPQNKPSIDGFRPDKVEYRAQVQSHHGGQDAVSVESGASTRMIIKKDVEYTVEYTVDYESGDSKAGAEESGQVV